MSNATLRVLSVLVILGLLTIASFTSCLIALTTSADPGDDVGPMADTTPPTFVSFDRSPSLVGPKTVVSVETEIADESALSVNVSYGFDNSTWSTVPLTDNGSTGQGQTYTGRNPTSGYAYGTTISGTYSPGRLITFLSVYIYSSDSDTCWVRIRGYKASTSSWENIYYATSTGNGYKVSQGMASRGYTQWDITYYDSDQNDNIYYNYTYKTGNWLFEGDIPAPGSNPKVYYYFNATDSAGNRRFSNVFNYSVDITPPKFTSFTQPTGLVQNPHSFPIYTNVSDASGLGQVRLNWTATGMSGHQTRVMSRVSGSSVSGEYMGLLSAPATNTTFTIWMDAFDVGGNYNNTTTHDITWNPPPTIENMTIDPTHPNHLVQVNVSFDVYDADGVDTVNLSYSSDNKTWKNATTSYASGNRYWAMVAAGLGNPWVYLKVYANDTVGGLNESFMMRYYVDRTKPRLYTPYITPQYPNASAPVWVVANVTDDVGLMSVRVLYSMDGGTTWNSSNMSKTSNVDSLTVGGYVRSYDTTYFQALQAVGSMMGAWDGSVSGYGGTPPSNLFTDVDVIFLDGTGSTWYYNEAIAAATAGKIVIVSDNIWDGVRSQLGYPSYTSLVSHGFTSYGLSVGRGAVVMTYSLTNNNYLGYSYNGYSSAIRANLVAHLKETHVAYMPYSGPVPASGTSMKVLYRINATDLSNLSSQTNSYEYTTDGVLPTFSSSLKPPSPAAWDQTRTFPVWAVVDDDIYLGRMVLHYSLNGGSTWNTVSMNKFSGNSTHGNYTATIPATWSSTWVNYWYEVFDRANNSAKDPATTVYSYQTSDPPTISGLHSTPTVGNAVNPVTVSATIRDPDVVSTARVTYRYGTGPWHTLVATAGTNDLWSASIPTPGNTTIVYYFFEARDTVGVWATSGTATYTVDGNPPKVKVDVHSPEYPSSSTVVKVNGTASDGEGAVTPLVQYKVGSGGSIVGLVPTFDPAMYTDRNPTSGYKYGGYLTKTYYLKDELTYLNLYAWTDDYDTLYVRVRCYRNSTGSWETIYASSGGNGYRIDRYWTSSGYGAFEVYVYDSDYNDDYYYNITYKAGGSKLHAMIPAPGFSTWVYYRITATDAAGNTNATQWYRYWADGSAPYLVGSTSPGSQPAEAPVSISATFADEHAIDRAEIFYSYGGAYQNVSMTASDTSNTTHLKASGSIPPTKIPLTVRYYFRTYDKAGNPGQSAVFTYTTYLGPVAEGNPKTYNASNLYSPVGFKTYDWDFEYDGSFDRDSTGVSATHTFMDNGTYVVALRLYDNNDVMSFLTFTQNVTDMGPKAAIGVLGTTEEGQTLTIFGSGSISYPDPIVSYEWDVDYDGVSFDVDRTSSVFNYTFMENGTYWMALRVTDDDGSVSVTDRLFFIRDLSPQISVVAPSSVDEGSQFTLDATNTTSWPDALGTFEWDLDYDTSGFDVDATGNTTNHVFMDDGTYRVMLRVHDEDSFSEWLILIQVRDLRPTANITAPAFVNEGAAIVLDGNASTSYPDDIVTWQWDLDFTGTFSVDVTGASTNHVFMDNGNYTVALRVTDDDGSRNTTTMVITVHDLAPVPSVEHPDTVDEGEQFFLNATGSSSYPDEIISMEWDLEYDGVTFDRGATGAVIGYTYMENGNYTVAFRLTDDDLTEVILTIDIVVRDLAPVAGLRTMGDLLEGNEITLLSDLSTSWPDELKNWEWDMDYDGVTFDLDAGGPTVDHVYMDDGEYTIALRVTDDDGSTNIGTLTVSIGDLGPTAKLLGPGPLPGGLREGSDFTFNAKTHSESFPDDLVEFEWWWEADGEMVTGEDNTTLTVTFHSPGEHTFWLLVRDEDGSESVDNVTLTVADKGPVAVLTSDPTPEGDTVLLNASGCQEPGMDLVAYRWDVDGDGEWDEVTSEAVYETTWTSPGRYEVTMEVEDEDGSTAWVQAFVTITDVAPVADAGGPYEVDEGVELTLDGTGSFEPGGDIVEYAWDVIDDGQYGIQLNGEQVQWSWVLAGTYTVSLYITDRDGSIGHVSVEVTVLDLDPVFERSFPETLDEGEEGTFQVINLTDPGTAVFQVVWSFGDGSTAEGYDVDHIYIEDGSYTLNVTILDNDGRDHIFEFGQIEVVNRPPEFKMDITRYDLTEDELFTLQLRVQDTVADTVTFEVDGPGGKVDPQTGTFTWTPLDEHVGPNTFTFTATDEDGGTSELVVTLDVEDVDNDFIGGMSTAGGSALILVIILAVVMVAVLYMRYRGRGGPGEDDEWVESETVVDEPPSEAPQVGPEAAPAMAPAPAPDTVPAPAPAPVPAPAPAPVPAPVPPPVEPHEPLEPVADPYADAPPLPDGTYVPSGPAAAGEAVSGEADQLPPPPPPPVGPQFNQVLEDRASESEVETDEENEPDHASEWEIID